MSAFSQQIRERWQRLGPGLRLTLQYFILTRVLITVFAIASERLIGHYDSVARRVVDENSHRFGNAFFDAWSQWDSNWYLQIAMHGYTGVTQHNGEVDIAFFPLYPYLVHFLAWPFGLSEGAILIMGLLVSSAGFIAGGYFLYSLAERKFG